MTLPVEAYRNISRYQAKFLDIVSSSIPDNDFSSAEVVKVVDNIIIASNIGIMDIYIDKCLKL